MAYKDEYEVGRLYTDGEFARGARRAVRGRRPAPRVLHGAAGAGEAEGRGARRRRRRSRFGPWTVAAAQAAGARQALRGTAVRSVRPHRGAPPRAAPDRRLRGARRRAARTGSTPTSTRSRWRSPTCRRRSAATATSSWRAWRSRGRARSELLNRFDPERYPRPTGPAVAGQFRGIRVTVGLTLARAQRRSPAAPAGTCRAWRSAPRA